MLLSLACFPSRAEPPGSEADKRCADILASAPWHATTFKDARAQGAHGCIYRDVVLPFTAFFSWTIETISLEDLEFDRVREGRPPPALKLRLDGVRQLPRVRQPYMTYAFRYSTTPITLALEYRLDEPRKELRIKRLAVSGDGVGLIEAAALLTNVDPSAPATPLAWSRIALQSARLHFDNRGFMQHFVIMPAAAILLGDASDPDAKAAMLKQQAISWLQQRLGSIGARPATIDALSAFVEALPMPHKVLDVQVELPHPIAFGDMFALGEDSNAALRSLGPDAITAQFGP